MTRTALRPFITVLIASLSCVATGCDQTSTTQFDDESLNASRKRIDESARRSDCVFVGAVAKVGQPPPAITGRAPPLQTVTYRVERVLRGALSSDSSSEVQVQHLVMGGSRNTGPDVNASQLSPRVFAAGRKLIVMVAHRNGRWHDVSENYGTLPATEANLRALESLLARPDNETKTPNQKPTGGAS